VGGAGVTPARDVLTQLIHACPVSPGGDL